MTSEQSPILAATIPHSEPLADPTGPIRRSVYTLLIVIGVALMFGRIMAVDSIDRREAEQTEIGQRLSAKRAEWSRAGYSGEQLDAMLAEEQARLWEALRRCRPFLSANDRSRWCMIRVLVEKDLQVPGVPYAIDKVVFQDGDPRRPSRIWHTIDMVRHGQPDDPDAKHYYSSKPALIPTIMAGQYWLIYHTTGWTLDTHPYLIARIMLVTWNLFPLLIYFILLSRLIERFGGTDWGRIFAMGGAVFGTFLVPFSMTLNNHLHAAVCCVIAIYCIVRICFDGSRNPWYFILAGVFTVLTAASELPALSFVGLCGIILLWRAPIRTLLFSAPAVILVLAASMGTNWIAHHSLKPAYMHRPAASHEKALERNRLAMEQGLGEVPESERDPKNWYDYPRSHWMHPVGIDKGEPSILVYWLHCLIGHHGIFSLTPIWILSVIGGVMWLVQSKDPRLRVLAGAIAMVSLVVLAFYLSRPLLYRNYGGMTAGLRWMFWFAPMWLIVMLPCLDRFSKNRFARVCCYAALAVSVMSAAYPIWNPWVHPWMLDYLHYIEWYQI